MMKQENAQAPRPRRFNGNWLAFFCLLPFATFGLSAQIPQVRVWMYVSLMHLTSSEQGQIEAVYRMGKLGPVAAPGIRIALHDPNTNIRYAALSALETWGPGATKVAPDLVKLLGDDRQPTFDGSAHFLSFYSAHCLKKIGRPAIPALRGGLKDPSSKIREMAAQILGRFGPEASRCLPQLVELLNDQDRDVRLSAADAIHNIAELKGRLPIRELKQRYER